MKIPEQNKSVHGNKVRQAIRRYGVEYQFIRAKIDDFGQPMLDGDGNLIPEKTIAIKGIFHESGSNFVLITSEAAQIQTKPKPAILAMWDSIKDVAVNDLVSVPPESGIRYKITSVNDVGNVRLFADISLEVIADGLQV